MSYNETERKHVNTIEEIRSRLLSKYWLGEFTGNTVELIGASFVASEETIFGDVNDDYVQRELEWYKSMSLYVGDIAGETPKIWREHSSKNGEINSNYGYLIFSDENHNQYNEVLAKLLQDPDTRQAVMIYTRPTMHDDWNKDGMSDFVCTNTVSYFLRNGFLETVVQMRSNDVVFGYRNDYAWQKYVQKQLVNDLNGFGVHCAPGRMFWNASSLHIYERHYRLLDDYGLTGKHGGRVS